MPSPRSASPRSTIISDAMPHAQASGQRPLLTRQALVAIGGKARRIREAGIRVAVSKSFLTVLGRPLLHWNLLSLHAAGIRDVILCGDDPSQLQRAGQVLEALDVQFSRVVLFRDPGLGVHGLPYQARRYLDELFFFDCGHSIMKVAHYGRLSDELTLPSSTIAFSAFVPHPSNPRQPVYLKGHDVYVLEQNRVGSLALAHPMLVNQEYVRNLPLLDFAIEKILLHYGMRSAIRCVQSEMPPEFDLPAELQNCMTIYETYLSQIPFGGLQAGTASAL